MKSIKGTRTEQNLLKSFAGESQARSRYTFFAEVAKKEGYEQIAGVFMETAEQEREHAKRFFNFLEGGDLEITATYPAGKVGTTSENLLAAAKGENEEWDVLYKEFAEVAAEEGFPAIAATFRNIAKVEAEQLSAFDEAPIAEEPTVEQPVAPVPAAVTAPEAETAPAPAEETAPVEDATSKKNQKTGKNRVGNMVDMLIYSDV